MMHYKIIRYLGYIIENTVNNLEIKHALVIGVLIVIALMTIRG